MTSVGRNTMTNLKLSLHTVAVGVHIVWNVRLFSEILRNFSVHITPVHIKKWCCGMSGTQRIQLKVPYFGSSRTGSVHTEASMFPAWLRLCGSRHWKLFRRALQLELGLGEQCRSFLCFVEVKLCLLELVTSKSNCGDSFGFLLKGTEVLLGNFSWMDVSGFFLHQQFCSMPELLETFCFMRSQIFQIKDQHVAWTKVCLPISSHVQVVCIFTQNFLFLLTSHFPDT